MALRGSAASPLVYGRTAGTLLFVILACAGLGMMYVPATLIVPGDATATADNIRASEALFRLGIASDVVLALAEIAMVVVLYRLFEPVSRTLALVAAFARLTMTAIHGADLLNRQPVGERVLSRKGSGFESRLSHPALALPKTGLLGRMNPRAFFKIQRTRMNHLGKAFLALCLLWATAAAQQPLKVVGMPAEAPLTLLASASPEALTLDVKMKRGWHLYAADVGGGRPVSVTMERRSDFVARGALVVPVGKEGKLLGAFRLVLPLRKKGRGNAIACRFDFMACDPLQCQPPMSVKITGELRRLKVLVVVDREDARSKRISDFLRRSGMSPKITTYAKVRTRACNAHDVVLADSKLFQKNEAGSVGRARGFPKTESPIVAVGFLGTELIEGQGIAMTSGYI